VPGGTRGEPAFTFTNSLHAVPVHSSFIHHLLSPWFSDLLMSFSEPLAYGTPPLLFLFPAAVEMAYHRKIDISHTPSHNQVIKETAMKEIKL